MAMNSAAAAIAAENPMLLLDKGNIITMSTDFISWYMHMKISHAHENFT